MAGLALSGLASGFDWKGIVDQLIEVSRAPQKRMQREKAELSTRTTALNEVRSSVTSLKSSVGTLATESALLKKAATMADPTSKWNATAGTSATAGDYNFQVKQTATAGIYRGRSNVGSPGATNPFTAAISSLSMGATFVPGFFMVNGQRIEVAAGASLKNVADAIIAQTAGTSNPLYAGYDSTTQKFSIYSPSGGAVSIGSAADTSNLVQILGLSPGPVPSATTITSNLNLFGPPPSGAGLSSLADDRIINLFLAMDYDETDLTGSIQINGQDIQLRRASYLSHPEPPGNTNQPPSSDSGLEQLVEFVTSYNIQLDFVPDSFGNGLYARILSPGSLSMVDGGSTFPVLQALGLTAATPQVTTAQGYISANPIGKLNSAASLGSANFSTALTGSGTAGSFFVNGVQVSYDTSADSVQNLLDRITNSAAGVTASFDSVNDSIVLTNKKTGALGVSISTINPTSGGVSLDSRGVVNALFGLNQNTTLPGSATITSSTDRITLAGSSLSNGQIVRISNLAGGDDLLNNREYFVVNASGDSFQLSETLGGAVVNFSSATTATVQLAGNLNQANLVSVVAGRDAIFNINNGGDFISNSNTLDQTVHGINGLTVDVSGDNIVSGSTPVTQKITVKGDPSAATAAVNDFITKYNALQAVIEKHTKVTYADGKVTAGVLAGSREMADISRSLRQSLFRDANGSGTIRRLADLGVSTSGIENTISLSNAALLESQINTAGTDVLDFFTRSTSGLVPRLNALLGDSSTDVTAASGKIGIQLTSIQKQNTSLDRQIADLERRLESQRQLMESSFIAMERAQARFQQQSSYLQKTFSGNSK